MASKPIFFGVLPYAYSINSLVLREPIPLDINVRGIIAIVPTETVVDGVKTPSFQIIYRQPTKIDNDIAQVLNAGLAVTVAQLLAVIVAEATDNYLTEYIGCTEIDFRAFSSRNIILNDRFIQDRFYDAVAGNTRLYVDMENESDLKIFTVAGDQTT